MQILISRILRSFFKLSCVCATVFMVSYWFYKYRIEDKELCLVNYETPRKSQDSALPVVSLCLRNPFEDQRLKEISPDLNSSIYLQYLRGDVFDSRFKDIEYNNVTFNLSSYLKSEWVFWKNSSKIKVNNIVQKQHTVTFNGFLFGVFMKCFGVEIKAEYREFIDAIYNVYSQSSYLDGLNRNSHFLYVIVHYPKQFLLSKKNLELFVNNRIANSTYQLNVFIRNMEILNRRPNQLCMKDGYFYDDLVLYRHLEQIGCRTPYQTDYKQFPICSTKEEMRSQNCLFCCSTYLTSFVRF